MPYYWIIFIVLFVLMFAGGITFIIIFATKHTNSVIKRAQQIDPNVKTLAEANLVIQKDLAQSVGQKASNGNKNFCQNCGVKLNANAKFCHNCGKPQNND